MRDRIWLSNPGSKESNLRAGAIFLNSSWRIFDSGAREANVRVADHLLHAAFASEEAIIQDVLVNAIQAYFDAQRTEASWSALREAEAVARETVQATQFRVHRGASFQVDVLQATASLERITLKKVRSRGDHGKAMATLAYALGVSMDTRLGLADDLTDSAETLEDYFKLWSNDSEVPHPALRALRAQLKAAEEQIRIAQAEGLPKIDLTANFYHNGRPNQALSTAKSREIVVGVTLTIPLFEGFEKYYKVLGAQARADQIREETEDASGQLSMEIGKAHADALSAFENLDTSRRLLAAAESALAAVKSKYEKGIADVFDLLNTQATVFEAQQERIRCLAEWRLSKLRLLAAIGILEKDAWFNS